MKRVSGHAWRSRDTNRSMTAAACLAPSILLGRSTHASSAWLQNTCSGRSQWWSQ
jgi:hypothetical protein